MSSTRKLGCGLVPTFFSGFVGKPMNTCWLVVWNIFYCSYIGNVIIPTDVHSIIFQRGRSTTNQPGILGRNSSQAMSLESPNSVSVMAKRGHGYCVAEPRKDGAQVTQLLDGCTAQLGVARQVQGLEEVGTALFFGSLKEGKTWGY